MRKNESLVSSKNKVALNRSQESVLQSVKGKLVKEKTKVTCKLHNV